MQRDTVLGSALVVGGIIVVNRKPRLTQPVAMAARSGRPLVLVAARRLDLAGVGHENVTLPVDLNFSKRGNPLPGIAQRQRRFAGGTHTCAGTFALSESN